MHTSCPAGSVAGIYTVTTTVCELTTPNSQYPNCPPVGNYTMTVTASSNCDSIIIQNPGNLGITISATYNSASSTTDTITAFILPAQGFYYNNVAYTSAPYARIEFQRDTLSMQLITLYGGEILMYGAR